MNKTPDQTEYPLRTNSVKDTFNEESLNNVQHKLHTISFGTGQNDKTIAYKAFLEFIIDNSKDNLRLVSSENGSSEGRSSSKQNLSKVEIMLQNVLKEDILDLEDLFHLWKVIRQNTLINHEVLFIGLSKSPNNIRKADFLEHILSYLSKIPSSEIKLSDCNIIFSIYRICEKSDELLYRYIDFYEQVLSDDSTSVWMCSNFIKEISTLIDENRLTAANKIHILDKYAENINSKLLSFPSVKIMGYLIKSCPSTTDNKSELSQSECIRFLCKEKSLFNKIITDLGSQVEENIQDSACFDMTEKAQFLVFLASYIPDYGEMINYDMISSIWETALFIRHPKDLRNQLLKLIKDIPKNGQNFHLEDLDKFFQEKIINCRDILDFGKDEFECFRCLFVLANEYYSNLSEVTLLSQNKEDFPSRFDRLQIGDQKQIFDKDLHFEDGDFLFQVDAVPNTLKGYKALWNITRLSQDEKVAKLSRDLLIDLYTKLSPKLWAKSKEIREEYLNICFEELKGLLVSSRESWRILRCVDLLQAIIDETDREDHLQGPRSHAQLFKGKLLDITVCDQRFRPLKIRAYSKMLVSDLFSEVRQGFSDFKNSLIYLEDGHRKKQITDLQNERTLGSLGLKERSTWYVYKRNSLEAYLIQYDGTMNRKIREIFIKWFDTFSDNGKMSMQHCAEFIHSVTTDECLVTDRRVYEFFALHDDNKDCYLTMDNFLSFYLTCCKQRPHVVWSNLLSQGLSYDLRQPNKKREQKELGLSSHLCSIISSNKKYIQMLFSLLESNDEIAVKALQLLNRLPTDPQIFVDIVMLKGVRNSMDSHSAKPDWSYVLDTKNIYKLFYCLNIVEYLIESKRLGENEEEESEDESEDAKKLWSQGARLVEYKKRWFFDFVACGGYEDMIDVLQKLMMFKTSPTIEVYMTRIKYLMEEIDQVCYHKNNKRIYQDNLYM